MKAKDQVSADLDGEAAILSLRNGVYYGLNETGAQVWGFLSKPMAVGEIRDLLAERHGVSKERCERDVTALLERLGAEGLVEIRDQPTS